MHMSEVSLIGWIHTIACTAALIFGAWNIVAVKGTASHKLCGKAYVATIVIAMVLSLGVYRFDLPVVHRPNSTVGGFGIFHWLSVATLVLTLIGYYAASRQQRGFWAYTHPVAMTLSYYLLIGGLINELFVRVNVLRPFAFVVQNGRPIFGTTRAVEMSHHANELATVFLLVLFLVKVWRYRRQSNSTAGTPDPV
jgi:uncharacterized membrane protein